MTEEQIAKAVENLWGDFQNNQFDFSETSSEGTATTDGISVANNREAATFLTLTAALDLQRDARTHWQTAKTLWRDQPWIFQPATVVDRGRDSLASLFEQHGFRWPSKDAKWWYENAAVLHNQFDGDAMALLEAQEFDALRLHQFADTHFYGLGGQKVGGQWLKVIHQEVHPLDRIHEIPIPVDTHIEKVTNELRRMSGEPPFADGASGEIQQFWQGLCREHDLPPPIMFDTALWSIGNHWDDGGKAYLQSLTENVAESEQ